MIRKLVLLGWALGPFLLSLSLEELMGEPSLTLCLFKAVTGWPCPLCGGLRSWIAIGNCEPWSALILNPLTTLVYPVGFLCLLRQQSDLRPSFQKAFVVLALMNWAYLLYAR